MAARTQAEHAVKVRDERQPKHFWADNEIVDIYLPIIGMAGFSVYMLLCRYANQVGECDPSIAGLAKRLQVSQPTIRKAIKSLEKAKLITVKRGRKSDKGDPDSNLYTILAVKGRVLNPIEGVLNHVEEGTKPGLGGVLNQVSPNNTNQEQDTKNKDSAETAKAVPPAAETAQPVKPETKREGIEDKVYLQLPDGSYEGPYAPYGKFVKEHGGTFVQGEVLPAGAKVIAPANVRTFETVKSFLDAVGREKLPPGVDEKQFMDLGKKWAKANVDTACLGLLIRAWLNANKVAPPLAWTVGEITVLTRYAWGMCQNSIGEDDIAGYIKDTYESKDKDGRQFWRDKAIPFGNVASNVGVWKANQTSKQAKWDYDPFTGWKEPTNAK